MVPSGENDVPLQLVDPGVSSLTPLRDFMGERRADSLLMLLPKELIVLGGVHLRIIWYECQSGPLAQK